MKAIDEVVPPTNLKELQSLLGKINFVRRFISNLSQKVLPFSPLLKLKKDQKFIWGDEQQKAFDEIKQYMKEPPVLVPPQLDKPFKLYVAADTQTIGSALIQHRLGMSNFGNGVAVAVEALQDELDLVNVLRHAAPEAARPGGVVDVRMRRHGSQAQGGTQTNAMGGHLVDAVLHRGKAFRRRVTAGIHLLGQLLYQCL
jgi:hypothetical protein